ncbi:NCS2 family permease [Aeribacillus pallidus]|uniref:NCS2 family permease n=1 Tax=Aeribacillus pallidus TaxID=33936 RepID=UPI003D2152EC
MKQSRIGGWFQLDAHGSALRKEIIAGVIGFMTTVYIIAVNSFILSEAGIPLEGAVLATILTCFISCLLMGFWANTPIILVPGMGINAMFTYTLVQSMGLSWQEALAVVFISGALFVVTAFTRLSQLLSDAIPATLKEAITVGLGLFLMLIGLEKGGIVERGDNSIIALGQLNEPIVMATVISFFVAMILFLRNVPGNFLWSILFGTLLAWWLDLLPKQASSSKFRFSDYQEVFANMSFASWMELPFWVAVFSITMVIVFENIGLVHGHVTILRQPEKFKKAYQANAISAMLSGVFGTSPTVSSVESAAAMASGGRTGLTAVTTGILFLSSIFFIPYMKYIPDNAIAPILMIIGGLMIQNVRNLELKDLTEAFPAIFIIAMIPFTSSIADGIAIGFILYPILKVASGKGKDVSFPLYVIAGLFFINFVLHSVQL